MPSSIDPTSLGALIMLPQSGERAGDCPGTSGCDDDGDRASLAERTDDQLMVLARSGTTRALDVLISRHQANVIEIARKHLGDVTQALDAAQNAFVELCKYVPRYRPEGKFRIFLYRLILNQCLMHQRRARYSRRARVELASDRRVAAVPSTEAEALRQERRQEVQRALLRLRPKLRDVLILRFAVDLSYQEIADVLKVPIGTVKSRLSKGLNKLRDELARGG